MPITGFSERIDAGRHHPWAGAHRSRYTFAARYVAGARVLDAGCGPGYGSRILIGAGAAAVVGIDIDNATVVTARRRYPHPKVRFLCGSITSLPFGDGAFDAVVCLEAVEHVRDAELALREMRRVLRPEGIVLVSTPNASAYGGYSGNPYHFREFTLEDFDRLVAPHFAIIERRGQAQARAVGRWLTPWSPSIGNTPGSMPQDDPAGIAIRAMGRWVFNRLPPRAQDWIYSRMFGMTYYPTEAEFRFVGDGDGVERCPNIVYLLRPIKSGC
jgi:ubiquinone/menaquinone biosynthesis C-methylase UbiE